MKKIITLVALFFIILNTWVVQAELKVFTKEELEETSKKNQEISDRKIYFTFNSTYSPNSKDELYLKKLDTALSKLNRQKPVKLRKLYLMITKKLEDLWAQKRDGNWWLITKKHTRTYFLLEQINNKIADLDWNQDLGCQKWEAHMEWKICVKNTKEIINDSWHWYQTYDFIWEKWNNIMMMRCNPSYIKDEQTVDWKVQILCIRD